MLFINHTTMNQQGRVAVKSRAIYSKTLWDKTKVKLFSYLCIMILAGLSYQVGSKKYTRRALSRLSSYPNDYTYGLEFCHRDWTGEFSEETLDSAAHRCAELCLKYDLDPIRDIWTHQQVVGWKECPRWFVKNPVEFEKFKERVKEIVMPKKLEKWQKELGQKAVKELAERGIINNPEEWSKEEKLAEPAPTWLMLTVLARYAEEDEKNENEN